MIGVEQPKEKGGWGLDFAANIIGMEEQIYAQVPGNFNLQSDLVMPYIASHGTDSQIQVRISFFFVFYSKDLLEIYARAERRRNYWSYCDDRALGRQ